MPLSSLPGSFSVPIVHRIWVVVVCPPEAVPSLADSQTKERRAAQKRMDDIKEFIVSRGGEVDLGDGELGVLKSGDDHVLGEF